MHISDMTPGQLSPYRRLIIFDGADGPELRCYNPTDREPIFKVKLTNNELMKLSIEMLKIRKRQDHKEELEKMKCDS